MPTHDARSHRYSIADTLPISVDDLDAGMNVLVSGPAMSGKRRLVFDLLAPPPQPHDPIVVLTTDDPAARVRAQFEDRGVSVDPSTVRIVDASGAPGDDDPVVERLSSPGNLTGMGVGFTRAVDGMGTPSTARVGFLSISTLLQYVDDQRTFSFLHVLLRRSSAAGYLGVYSIDPTTHDEKFVNVVTSIFDAVIDVREVDAEREVRVRGLDSVDPVWMALSN
ncbi:RAD55 family ATPase [Haloplanus halobius]|uniref:RAD55 family ATPase n=1 Tax=Haloplanus halobius TaxID=2934938 RepID=UPI00200F8A5C|nr:hypothetical protein [Haloplanus sp. XH21]